jgi:symplekin
MNIAAIAKSASDEEEFLKIVQDPPEGSDELLEVAITELCCEMPSERLVSSVLECYSRKKCVKMLIPVLPFIGKETVIEVLPDIIELPQSDLPGAIRRLCTKLYVNQAAPVLEPKELLVLLHTMDQANAATLKNAMTTINICLTMHEEFNAEVLAATLNQLITRIPLPPLFMRTVLQSLSSAPSLREFIVRLLDQLAAKQIWTNATQWKGWLMAVQYTAPESFQIVLRLPVDVLAKALEFFNDNFRSKLVVYASSGEVNVPDATLEMLSKYQNVRSKT